MMAVAQSETAAAGRVHAPLVHAATTSDIILLSL
jgi:hypothetical protein